MPSTDRPNILFLMSDQHRPDRAGFAGDRIVRTPQLDALAAGAVVFDNAYTPSPICIPARQALAAGQFPATCGSLRYSSDLAPGHMTFARRFSQYAYSTVCCGKLHHMGTDQHQGWRTRICGDSEIAEQYVEGRVDSEFARWKQPSQWWNWSKEVRRAGIGASPHLRRDRLVLRGALDHIDEYFTSPYYDQQQGHRPTLLKVSLTLPHYPYLTDEERFSYYLNRVPVFHRQTTFDHPMITRDWDQLDGQVSEREVRRATAAYYGMIDELDGMLGQVVERLRGVGQDLDDWIIIYTSDHGDLIGEHGLWMKYKYFDASVRVPLFIRWPKRYAARRVAENVNLCDLFATLCDLAGIPTPDGLDSRSLAGLMSGDASRWDNETVSQLEDTTMIKRDHLKYQYFGSGAPEVLFDLAADPDETRNVIADPTYAQAIERFRARLPQLRK